VYRGVGEELQYRRTVRIGLSPSAREPYQLRAGPRARLDPSLGLGQQERLPLPVSHFEVDGFVGALDPKGVGLRILLRGTDQLQNGTRCLKAHAPRRVDSTHVSPCLLCTASKHAGPH
jgi:hypothetical protein